MKATPKRRTLFDAIDFGIVAMQLEQGRQPRIWAEKPIGDYIDFDDFGMRIGPSTVFVNVFLDGSVPVREFPDGAVVVINGRCNCGEHNSVRRVRQVGEARWLEDHSGKLVDAREQDHRVQGQIIAIGDLSADEWAELDAFSHDDLSDDDRRRSWTLILIAAAAGITSIADVNPAMAMQIATADKPQAVRETLAFYLAADRIFAGLPEADRCTSTSNAQPPALAIA